MWTEPCCSRTAPRGALAQLTEAQQRSVDIHKACRVFGQTGDYSELVRLGIFSADADEDDEDKT